ncbi:Uncharacterised protein [Chryseobacterium gleum]|jgi:hypothetical protein|uniref:Uncharacterized protein n=2 Tax=Chryseobacterium gleum TaxID=250 RepID=A0A448B229_CHRGE|nr:hypothetical protein HMPREF0204_12287 [Chryseobacterium gleum ATCC 35910]VEE07470.1 Uncharacterised protein [Chryseobacterium gleum]
MKIPEVILDGITVILRYQFKMTSSNIAIKKQNTNYAKQYNFYYTAVF